jgi:hypothetical protein
MNKLIPILQTIIGDGAAIAAVFTIIQCHNRLKQLRLRQLARRWG